MNDRHYKQALRLFEKAIEIWNAKIESKYELADKYYDEGFKIYETYFLTEDERQTMMPF